MAQMESSGAELVKVQAVPEVAIENGQMRLGTLAQVLGVARIYSRTELCPQRFRGKAETCAIAMYTAITLGLDPVKGLKHVYVVNGEPALDVTGMKAAVLKSGLLEDEQETKGLDERGKPWWCTRVKRRGISGWTEWKFTWDQAERAGLAKKENYQKNPERMVAARARGRAYGDAFPDVLVGMWIADELEITAEAVEARDVTPTVKRELRELFVPEKAEEAPAAAAANAEVPVSAASAVAVAEEDEGEESDLRKMLGGIGEELGG